MPKPKSKRAKRPVPLPVAARKKRAATTRRSNPSESFTSALSSKAMDGVGGDIAYGIGAFAAPKVSAALVRKLIATKYPKFATHAGAIAALVVAIAIWTSPKYWSMGRKRAVPLQIGSAIGAIQVFIQTYVPGLSWLLGDVGGVAALPAAPATAKTPEAMGAYARHRNMSQTRYVSPGELDSMRAEETMSRGGFAVPPSPQVSAAQVMSESPEEAAMGANEDHDEFAAETGDDEDMYSGVFSR